MNLHDEDRHHDFVAMHAQLVEAAKARQAHPEHLSLKRIREEDPFDLVSDAGRTPAKRRGEQVSMPMVLFPNTF